MAKKTFKAAVELTSDVSDGYQPGLRALGKYSNRVSVYDRNSLGGSVDIDSCTEKIYPQANRWDYALAYKSEAYFIEVHSANTSQVSIVQRKLQWLKDWLHSKAPEINKLKAKKQPFSWIMTNGCHIKTDSKLRQASQYGLTIVSKLKLPIKKG